MDFLSIRWAGGFGMHFIMPVRRSPVGGTVAPTGEYVSLGFLPDSRPIQSHRQTWHPHRSLCCRLCTWLNQAKTPVSQNAHYTDNEGVREGILLWFVDGGKQIPALSFPSLVWSFYNYETVRHTRLFGALLLPPETRSAADGAGRAESGAGGSREPRAPGLGAAGDSAFPRRVWRA